MRGVARTFLAALAALFPLAAAAQDSAPAIPPSLSPPAPPAARAASGPELRLAVSEGRVLRVPGATSTVLLADPEIADVQAPNPGTLFVFGRKPGRTTLFALGPGGAVTAQWRVVVRFSDEELRQLLRAEVGDWPVALAYTPNGAVLSGTVPTPQAAERVRAVAERFLGPGGTLVNNLRVTGAVQVALRVRVAEVSRSVSRELGVNWETVAASGSFGFGLLTGRAVLDAAGAVSRSATGVGSLFGTFQRGRTSATGVLDALAGENLLRVLAEPTLVSASGETARFLSGGEFPIPISQGLQGITIAYRRFGVALDFTPTVLSDDLISLKVAPEVSELSDQGAVTQNGFNIPSLTSRRAETTVELGSGQSLVIAGLIQNSTRSSISRFPGLGDIPVLGALFRSTRFQRNETELLIVVTPTIVRPVPRGTELPLPTDVSYAPSDFELFLLGRLEGDPRGAEAARRLREAPLRGDVGFLLR